MRGRKGQGDEFGANCSRTKFKSMVKTVPFMRPKWTGSKSGDTRKRIEAERTTQGRINKPATSQTSLLIASSKKRMSPANMKGKKRKKIT
jgi:hypothetical protein